MDDLENFAKTIFGAKQEIELVVIVKKFYPNFTHLSFGHIERKRQLSLIAVKHNKHITKMETFNYHQKSMTKLC